MLLLAPPCASWTRVSRGTSMRSRINPLGCSYDFVQEANITIARRPVHLDMLLMHLVLYMYISCVSWYP